MKKGFFITFEGVDGCGKTTQLTKVKEYLEQKGFCVVTTREPGSLDTGKEIRNILLHSKSQVSDRCEMFLFLADRANHVEMFIEPNLQEGKIVLCDRYTDSTIAYQGFARGQDIKLLKDLNNIATGNLKPDLTLLYDVDTEISLQRVGREQDRMEASGVEFHKKVRNGYIELKKENPLRIKMIDANKSIDEVFENTKKVIDELIQVNQGV